MSPALLERVTLLPDLGVEGRREDGRERKRGGGKEGENGRGRRWGGGGELNECEHT